MTISVHKKNAMMETLSLVMDAVLHALLNKDGHAQKTT